MPSCEECEIISNLVKVDKRRGKNFMFDNEVSKVNITAQVVVDRPICGFWRRLLAFCIDCSILWVLGSLLGLMFFEQFSQLGQLGSLLGFIIATVYFGVLNSKVGKGQSLGKRLLKIRVVHKDGGLIELKTSLLRAALLSIPMCSNGAFFNGLEILGKFVVSLIFLLVIGMIYFYIFNTKTRQSLHDIVCGTYVYRADASGVSTESTVARVHYIIYLLIVAVVGIGTLYMQRFPLTSELQALDSVNKEISGLNGAYFTDVSLNRFKSGNQETKSLKVAVYVSKKTMQDDAVVDNIAKIILEKYQEVYSVQRIDINVIYGYNIGIATGWTNQIFAKSPGDWKEKLHILQLPNEKPLPLDLNKTAIEKLITDIRAVYNTGDNKAFYNMMSDSAKATIPYADFDKGMFKVREVGKMNNAVYTHYTHFQQSGLDVFVLMYDVDFGAGKGIARVVVMPKDETNWQFVGFQTGIMK
jgi:uncharacterized RDD family membrane protein YckC